MDYFGINSPADLPKLKEVFAESLIEPTSVRLPDTPDADTQNEP
jgi:segregation and condensation protein B